MLRIAEEWKKNKFHPLKLFVTDDCVNCIALTFFKKRDAEIQISQFSNFPDVNKIC